MKTERTPPRGRLAVDMLKNLGTRLSSDERVPYEVPEHDDVLDFNEPTEDIVIMKPKSAESEKKS